jgi:hypothetical protein
LKSLQGDFEMWITSSLKTYLWAILFTVAATFLLSHGKACSAERDSSGFIPHDMNGTEYHYRVSSGSLYQLAPGDLYMTLHALDGWRARPGTCAADYHLCAAYQSELLGRAAAIPVEPALRIATCKTETQWTLDTIKTGSFAGATYFKAPCRFTVLHSFGEQEL